MYGENVKFLELGEPAPMGFEINELQGIGQNAADGAPKDGPRRGIERPPAIIREIQNYEARDAIEADNKKIEHEIPAKLHIFMQRTLLGVRNGPQMIMPMRNRIHNEMRRETDDERSDGIVREKSPERAADDGMGDEDHLKD